MNLVVIFFLIISVPDKPPIIYDHKSVSMQECLEDVAATLKKIGPASIAGGGLQVGCFVRPGKENDTLKQ